MKRLHKILLCSLLALTTAIAMPAVASSPANNHYTETRFVANKASYQPEIVDPKLIDAWGIAIRPAGLGGHFWVAGKDTSFEYIGDVQASADPTLRTLHTDPQLTHVSLPVGGDDHFATGVVFSNSTDNFVITQAVKDAAPITAPAKFLFASDGGIISVWTERQKTDGTFDRPLEALAVIDQSQDGAQFFGLAISKDYSRLYAADFGAHPGIKAFDSQFQPLAIFFDQPFDTNKNGQVDPGEYAPFNIEALPTPQGESHLFVTYAKTQACPQQEIAKGTCAKGELLAGEEDTSKPGQGRVAEFTEDGQLVTVWKDGGHLSAPWGVTFAPDDFGALSGMLLVGNFGDGYISAYDPTTYRFKDFMRDEKGKPVKIEKLWGLLFGNGQSLGDSNALYFSAGPNDEQDGLFGSLRLATKK